MLGPQSAQHLIPVIQVGAHVGGGHGVEVSAIAEGHALVPQAPSEGGVIEIALKDLIGKLDNGVEPAEDGVRETLLLGGVVERFPIETGVRDGVRLEHEIAQGGDIALPRRLGPLADGFALVGREVGCESRSDADQG